MSMQKTVAAAIAGRNRAQARNTDLDLTISLLSHGWQAAREEVTGLTALLTLERERAVTTELECQRLIRENEELRQQLEEAVAFAHGHRSAGRTG